MTTPEIPKQTEAPNVPSEVKEIPETPEVGPGLAEAGVSAVPAQVTTQVADDKTGKPLTQVPATQTVTITLPANPTQLADWSHGSPNSPLTWLASFWLRVVKKALHFGWRVIARSSPN